MHDQGREPYESNNQVGTVWEQQSGGDSIYSVLQQ